MNTTEVRTKLQSLDAADFKDGVRYRRLISEARTRIDRDALIDQYEAARQARRRERERLEVVLQNLAVYSWRH